MELRRQTFSERQCTLGGMKGATLIAEEAQEEGRRKKSETVVPLVEQFVCKILANSINSNTASCRMTNGGDVDADESKNNGSILSINTRCARTCLKSPSARSSTTCATQFLERPNDQHHTHNQQT